MGPPRSVAASLALLGIVLVALLDRITGDELSFSIFYLLPTMLATWTAGLPFGIAFALLGAGLSYGVEALGGTEYETPYAGVWNASIRFALFLVVVALLSRLRDQTRGLRAMARHDALTGVYARGHFFELFEREVARAQRNDRPLTLAYLDLDGFKLVNDSHGHAAGDHLLKRIADILKSGLRAVDIVARLGGDEFVLLLPDTGEGEARALLERLHREICAGSGAAGMAVTASVGAVSFRSIPGTPEEMVRRVDHLMYQVKAAGKNDILVIAE